MRRRISLLGWLALVGLPLVAFTAMRFPREALFQIFGLWIALLFVSIGALFFRRADLKVQRQLPQYATAGQKVRYAVRVTNLSRFALRNYLLSEQAPDPTPSKALFLSSTEPGEELRNSFDQTFVAYRWMWIVRRRLLLKAEDFLGKPIAPGGREVQHLEFTPLRRGVIVLNNLQVVLPEPLGLLQRVLRVRQQEDAITVLPKRYAFAGFELDGEARNQLGGDVASAASGQSGEFVSLREYRPGDPLKHIHWRSWAKAGKPVVKVYEDQFFPRYGLVLDNFVSLDHEQEFEVAVSLAATFAGAADSESSLLDFMFVQQGAKIHRIGKNVGNVDSMLELLAGMDMEDSPDWEGLSGMVAQHADDMSTCIVVLSVWSEEREAFLQKLAASGVELCVLLVGDPETQSAPQCPEFDVHFVSVSNPERALETLSQC